MVNEWCSKRETENNTSYNCRILVIKTFVNFLRARNLTTVEPPLSLKPEKKKYIPHAFLDDELDRFFYECDHISPSQSKGRISDIRRITCPVFFRLLYSSGIRTTEARLLKVEDVDLEHGILNIRASKGYDQHYVALHSSMTNVLLQYDTTLYYYSIVPRLADTIKEKTENGFNKIVPEVVYEE